MFFATLKKYAMQAACGLALSFVAVSASALEPLQRGVDVVLFNYMDQQVFDVTLGETRVGSAGRFPYSGRRTKVGARLTEGAQTVTWRIPASDGGSSQTVAARNRPSPGERAREARFLAVHIYPDASVELKYSENFPTYSERGARISAEYEQRKGQ